MEDKGHEKEEKNCRKRGAEIERTIKSGGRR
jgi:hypothetical protein